MMIYPQAFLKLTIGAAYDFQFSIKIPFILKHKNHYENT